MLLMDPMPPINKVFSLIRQEERQRSIGSLNGSLNNPFVESTALLCKSEVPKYGANKQSIGHKKERPMCTHCGLLGHTMDKCYKLHGFPPGYKTRGKAPIIANQTFLSGLDPMSMFKQMRSLLCSFLRCRLSVNSYLL